MPRLGLSKDEINKVLEENGISGTDIVSDENVRNAISVAIAENNKELEKRVTAFVSKELNNKIRTSFR